MSDKARVLVTGAGGFIGHHLVRFLKERNCWVRGVDVKAPEYESTEADEFLSLDLRRWENCLTATDGIDEVYALASDMGGMGFISGNHAQILHNNALINLHSLEAAVQKKVKHYFYSSSACIYPAYKQVDAEVTPLREEDAYPADPQDGYGWEKLVTERACIYYREQYGLETRVARFHNIYGPLGSWDGGREKAPAAMCRKIAVAKLTGSKKIQIWGDGEQTRSFCYIDDCVEGIYRLMRSSWAEPLNIGQDQMVTINQLADIVAGIAGIKIEKEHVPGPQGVRGRNSDNSRVKEVLKWVPETSLEDGLAKTYAWIEKQVKANALTYSSHDIVTLRPWRVLASEQLLTVRPWIEVVRESLSLPNGEVIDDFYAVRLPDFVVVVARTIDGRLIAERRYKHGAGTVTLGTPAGYLMAGEDPLDGARRELLEETGYVSSSWKHIGRFIVDGNRGCGTAHIFLARDCEAIAEPDGRDLEDMQVELMHLRDFWAEIRSGTLHELCTPAALGLASMELGEHE